MEPAGFDRPFLQRMHPAGLCGRAVYRPESSGSALSRALGVQKALWTLRTAAGAGDVGGPLGWGVSQVKLRIELPPPLEITILCFIFRRGDPGEVNAFYVVVPNWDTMLHTINGFLAAAVGFPW